MKRFKIVNKFRFYTFVTVLILIISFAGIYLMDSVIAYADSFNTIKYELVNIEKGDTLWNIALEYKEENEDIRDIVYEIKNINNLDDGFLKAGNTIMIPIK